TMGIARWTANSTANALNSASRATLSAGEIGTNVALLGGHGARAAIAWESFATEAAIKTYQLGVAASTAGPKIIFSATELAAGFWFMAKFVGHGKAEIDCCVNEAKRIYRVVYKGKAPGVLINNLAKASCFFDMWEKNNLVATVISNQVQFRWNSEIADNRSEGDKSKIMSMTNEVETSNSINATPSLISTNSIIKN
ncbi:MAG: hypothetical protein WCG27_10470, partial [Pseudomonadota bacterium]